MRTSSLLLGFHLLKRFVPVLAVLTVTALLPGQTKASSQPYVPDHGVNYAIGNKYVVETDLVIQGPTALFDFQRTYNSTSTENGILGYGWSCSVTDRLEIDGSTITRVLSTGRHIAYESDGAGGWVSRLGETSRIVGITGGYELQRANRSVHTYAPRACQKHDGCYDQCARNCSGMWCKTLCDLKLGVSNSPYGGATLYFGKDAYETAKEKYGCNECKE